MTLLIRRSATTSVQFSGTDVVVSNFITGKSIACNERGLSLIASLDCWTPFKNVLEAHNTVSPKQLLGSIIALVDADVLLVHGSANAEIDEQFLRHWEWGVMGGLFHFGISHFPWATQDETAAFISNRAIEKSSPALFVEHASEDKFDLPDMRVDGKFYQTLAGRVSTRRFIGEPIALQALSQCLFAGFGIVDTVDAGELGILPFKWTPSGGARNPFEAYVYVFRVSELKVGLYHYSGKTHSLKKLDCTETPTPGSLLANQNNLDDCSAIIFLVAEFERTMWKYPNPTGYRVLLIEAGHVAQNILLTATHEGVGCLPTCAMNDSTVRAHLGLSRIQQAPIHCVVLGVSQPTCLT